MSAYSLWLCAEIKLCFLNNITNIIIITVVLHWVHFHYHHFYHEYSNALTRVLHSCPSQMFSIWVGKIFWFLWIFDDRIMMSLTLHRLHDFTLLQCLRLRTELLEKAALIFIQNTFLCFHSFFFFFFILHFPCFTLLLLLFLHYLIFLKFLFTQKLKDFYLFPTSLNFSFFLLNFLSFFWTLFLSFSLLHFLSLLHFVSFLYLSLFLFLSFECIGFSLDSTVKIFLISFHSLFKLLSLTSVSFFIHFSELLFFFHSFIQFSKILCLFIYHSKHCFSFISPSTHAFSLSLTSSYKPPILLWALPTCYPSFHLSV